MKKQNRTASEVLLELEAKVNSLVNIIKTLDLNIKVISNKLNAVIENSNNKITVEAVDSSKDNLDKSKDIPYSPEFSIQVENSPQGFRRSSRPETYDHINLPPQIIGAPANVKPVNDTFVVPDAALKKNNTPLKQSAKEEVKFTEKPALDAAPSAIPIQQRVIDKNGKSIFLANVEIIDTASGKSVSKTRTNGAGKWMTLLPIGTYKVGISKRDVVEDKMIEVFQEFKVDGTQSSIELQSIIIK